MADGRGSRKIWVELKRLDRAENGPIKSKIGCVEIKDDYSAEETKVALRDVFQIQEENLVFKLRNHRGSLIPIKGNIASNSKSVPYVLEVLYIYQNIKPKPRSVEMPSHNETVKNKLQEILKRIENLEASEPELKQKRVERIKLEMNDLDKKLRFLNKRFHEADSSHWKGMFKKNPLW